MSQQARKPAILVVQSNRHATNPQARTRQQSE